jgi:hypothetical protein
MMISLSILGLVIGVFTDLLLEVMGSSGAQFMKLVAETTNTADVP